MMISDDRMITSRSKRIEHGSPTGQKESQKVRQVITKKVHKLIATVQSIGWDVIVKGNCKWLDRRAPRPKIVTATEVWAEF